jgi:hypothetical protein
MHSPHWIRHINMSRCQTLITVLPSFSRDILLVWKLSVHFHSKRLLDCCYCFSVGDRKTRSNCSISIDRHSSGCIWHKFPFKWEESSSLSFYNLNKRHLTQLCACKSGLWLFIVLIITVWSVKVCIQHAQTFLFQHCLWILPIDSQSKRWHYKACYRAFTLPLE